MDLSGERVLVSRCFSYYGANAQDLPKHLRFQRPARFNRLLFADPAKQELVRYLEGPSAGPPRPPAEVEACRHLVAPGLRLVRLILSRKGFDGPPADLRAPSSPTGR
jgi:hypothetical protein